MVGIGLKMYMFIPYWVLSTHKHVKCYPTMTKERARSPPPCSSCLWICEDPRDSDLGLKVGVKGLSGFWTIAAFRDPVLSIRLRIFELGVWGARLSKGTVRAS